MVDARKPKVYVGVSAAAVLGLCGLAVLVATGHLNGVDRYAVRHLMPYKSLSGGGSNGLLARVFAYHGGSIHLGETVREAASAGSSSVILMILGAVLWRRGRRALASLWIAAFVAVNLAEGLVKLVVAKPQLYVLYHGSGSPMFAGFRHSFPSGHAARGEILAAAAACIWPRLWPVFATWLAAIVISAELGGVHTPSDLAGGLLLATAAIFAVAATDSQWGPQLERRLAGRRSGVSPENRGRR